MKILPAVVFRGFETTLIRLATRMHIGVHEGFDAHVFADHAENYSPDDNRFDLRPFLQPLDFQRQFAAIDEAVAIAAGTAGAAL